MISQQKRSGARYRTALSGPKRLQSTQLGVLIVCQAFIAEMQSEGKILRGTHDVLRVYDTRAALVFRASQLCHRRARFRAFLRAGDNIANRTGSQQHRC